MNSHPGLFAPQTIETCIHKFEGEFPNTQVKHEVKDGILFMSTELDNTRYTHQGIIEGRMVIKVIKFVTRF